MGNFILCLLILEIAGMIILAILPKHRPAADRLYWVQFAVMAAIALASAISKGITARKQRKLAEAINPDDPDYVPDENIKANQSLAGQLFNGRMAGAADAEKNILASQANSFGQINRNATSSSQALALAANAQGQTNQAFGQLQTQEAQSKYGLAQQLYNANTAQAGENNKVYLDKLRKFDNSVNAKTALQQAAANNRAGAWSDLASAAQAGAAAYGGGMSAGAFGNGGSGIQSGSVSNVPSSPYPWMSINTAAGAGAAPSQSPSINTNPQWYFNAVSGKWVRQY